MSNLDKRLDALEAKVQPPSGKAPFSVIFRDDDGSAWTSGDRDRQPLSEAQVDAIRAGCDLLIVVKYDKKIGLEVADPLGELDDPGPE
jgi:hypothetical protein